MEGVRNSEEQSQYLTSFFRIIMPSAVRQRRLVLPKRFLDEYGDELSRTVRLELPVGDLWHVKVVKSGCLVYLQDGLDKFLKNYSVGFGYFLLFNYKGDRFFHVHIFDLSATEIDYRPALLEPKSSSKKGFPTDVKIVEETDDFESPPPRKRQKMIPAYIDLTLNQTRAGKTQSGSAPSTSINEEMKSSNKKMKHSSKETDGNKVLETESALDRAEKYKTNNPSYAFQINASHITRCNVKLPTSFCREHEIHYAETVEVRDSDDTIYHMNCWKSCHMWCFGKGWSQFVKAKGLQTGDACVFEIVKKGIMKIYIFRAKSDDGITV